MAKYQTSSKSLWTGRQSDQPLYWYQHVLFEDINTHVEKPSRKDFGIIGYQCDEGVRRNQGRLGAVGGPAAVRRMLAPLSWHIDDQTQVVDFGDVVEENNDLEEAHNLVISSVCNLLEKQVIPVFIGGGHDLSFAHFKGIRKALGEEARIGIINLDAHFDLRKMEQERTSGTPFFQILEEDDRVKYFCCGIQKASNNKELFEYAHAKGVNYILAEDFNMYNWNKINDELLGFFTKVDILYLTIDMDGFSSAFAPGVSAPSPVGFYPDVVFKVLKMVKNSGILATTDIVELNPKYDIDNSTARLAAQLIACIIE